MIRVAPFVLVLSVALSNFAAVAAAAPPGLYHSPDDDGVSAVVPAAQSVTLHLYLDVGSVSSTADACHEGDGDELCGPQIDLTGGDFVFGELGPTKTGPSQGERSTWRWATS